MEGLAMDGLEHARELDWVIPDWPAPENVRAVCTTRQGGVSVSPFDSLNLGDHVGDEPDAVAANRKLVQEILRLPSEPLWLEQVHGTDVFNTNLASALFSHRAVPLNCALSGVEGQSQRATTPCATADASAVFSQDQVSVIMTADCLPVLFCNRQGTRVAAAHAGWRGLCNGVLEATIQAMDCAPADVMAWMGPAIGPDAFEVGAEVRDAFMNHDSKAEQAFKTGEQSGKYLADIYELARQRLQVAGVNLVYGGGHCTVSDAERFFSYRRVAKTGRMASLIWMV